MVDDSLDRDAKIAALYKGGKKLIDLASEFGLSRSRVQQIVAANGLTRRSRANRERSDKNGQRRAQVFEMLASGNSAREVASHFGISMSLVFKYIEELKRRDTDYAAFVDGVRRTKFARSGVSVGQFESIDAAFKAIKAFQAQRGTAKSRGIGWEITFAEWWKVWSESGHWSERGRAHVGVYVMARFGDVGPYKVGNVEIITHSQNISDSWKNVDRGLTRNGMGQLQGSSGMNSG